MRALSSHSHARRPQTSRAARPLLPSRARVGLVNRRAADAPHRSRPPQTLRRPSAARRAPCAGAPQRAPCERLARRPAQLTRGALHVRVQIPCWHRADRLWRPRAARCAPSPLPQSRRRRRGAPRPSWRSVRRAPRVASASAQLPVQENARARPCCRRRRRRRRERACAPLPPLAFRHHAQPPPPPRARGRSRRRFGSCPRTQIRRRALIPRCFLPRRWHCPSRRSVNPATSARLLSRDPPESERRGVREPS